MLQLRRVLLLLAGALVGGGVGRALAKVHVLDDDSFDGFVDHLAEDTLLFVDFFSPGCRQCQRLSAIIDYLDAQIEGQEAEPDKHWFQLAKVDCTKNPRLATVFGINKFPDLRFFRAGQWSTYEGKRTIEDIQEFKDRMAVVALPALNGEKVQELVNTEGVVFVLVTETDADPASEAPGVPLAATGLQQTVSLGTVTGEVLASLGIEVKSMPALVKIFAGLEGLSSVPFHGNLKSASYLAITRWIEGENHPLVSDFGPENLPRLGLTEKLLVIGVVDPRATETLAFKQAFAKVAAGMGMRHSDKLVFGTMNGMKLKGFAETLLIFDGLPRLVVLNVEADLFYSTPAKMPLEVVEMELFLSDVLSGGVPPTRSPSDTVRLLKKLWRLIESGGAWSLLLLVPLFGLVWVLFDTPEWEEQRAKAREAKRGAKEKEQAARLKSD